MSVAARGSYGRSPRVRGRLARENLNDAEIGKIPARAGTTDVSGAKTTQLKEDPRACGDDVFAAYLDAGVGGRSPRVRGRQQPE